MAFTFCVVFFSVDGVYALNEISNGSSINKIAEMVKGFNMIGDFHEGRAWFYKNEKYGFIDKMGNVIVPAKYYSVADFKEGRAWVANEDNHDHAWCGYIDLDGKEVVPIKYRVPLEEGYKAISFSEGLAAVQMRTDNDDSPFYGYIDKMGNEVIPAKFRNVEDFKNGIDEVKVAAKTGTSEIALIGQGYQSDMAISSVMMAFPAEKPKTMIYYAYIAPYDYYMHTKSKPINDLTRKVYYLTSTNTRPAAENPDITSTSSKVPDLINKELNEANAALNASSLTAIVIGNGNKVLDQYPKYGENIRGGSKVFLLTSKDDIILRDFTGWTRKDLLSYAYLANLNFEIEGSGVVYEQSVEANTTIHPKDTISFKLKNIESDLNSNNPEEE